MKAFNCQNCDNGVYFENTKCEACKCDLGYVSEIQGILAKDENGQNYNPRFEYLGKSYRYCRNHSYGVCNWLVNDESDDEFCEACTLNRTIPDISNVKHLIEWRNLEKAKHRLVYSLKRFGLPIYSKKVDNKGLAFDFLSGEGKLLKGQSAMTGHANGIITVNVSEADSVHREQVRKEMAEPYRTLIGHFRHETGHYYWERLILSDGNNLAKFRGMFGEETLNYSEALKKHYSLGAGEHWRNNFISKYAASHPWEDWAETWAHYLHLVDMLDTALTFGLAKPKNSGLVDPYAHLDFDEILEAGIPLTIALNSINRSMGQPDIYPFIVPQEVKYKMGFIHSIIKKAASAN